MNGSAVEPSIKTYKNENAMMKPIILYTNKKILWVIKIHEWTNTEKECYCIIYGKKEFSAIQYLNSLCRALVLGS